MQKKWIGAFSVAMATAGWGAAQAASNPSSILVTVPCAHDAKIDANDPQPSLVLPQCDELHLHDGYLFGRLEWKSGGNLVFTEKGPLAVVEGHGDDGSLSLALNANGSQKAFNFWYDQPNSIMQMPDVTMDLYVCDNEHCDHPAELTYSGPYIPQGRSLWSRHSEDTVGLQAAIAAEAAARQAADAALQAELDAEMAARKAGDAALQAALDAETAARQAADAAEAVARKQGDADTLAAANAYTDAQVAMERARAMGQEQAIQAAAAADEAADQMELANEAAARQAGDAAERAYVEGNFVHRTNNVAEDVTGDKNFTSNIGFNGDFRNSWNNQNANSVAPAQRSCPAGQVNVSTGAFTWACQTLADVGTLCGKTNAGPSCTNAENIGNLGFGASTTRTGALPSGGSGEHWFIVTWTNSGTSYHPHAYLTGSSAAYYKIDLYLDCNASTIGCGDGASNDVAVNKVNIETNNSGDRPLWPTPSPGQLTYVRVRPVSVNATCQGYNLVIQNG